MLKTADFKTCAQIQPKRGWCFVRKLFLCIFFFLFPIFSFATALPSGYTQLEYIQSNDNHPRIEVDSIKNIAENEIEFQTQIMWVGSSVNNGGTLEIGFGSSSSSSYNAIRTFGVTYDGYWKTNQTKITPNKKASKNVLYDISYKMYSNKVILEVKNGDTTEVNSTVNYSIPFDGNSVFYPTDYMGYGLRSARIYFSKVYRDGVLVFNGIPAKRNSDNAVGLYDTISNTFYKQIASQSGSGYNFIAGPVVETYTELEYLELQGEAYFNTNVYLSKDMDVEYEFMPTQLVDTGVLVLNRSVTNGGFLFSYNINNVIGSYTYNNINIDFFGTSSNGDRWVVQRVGSGDEGYVLENNKKYKLTIVNKVGTFYKDGTQLDTYTYTALGESPMTTPLYINASTFSNGQSTSPTYKNGNLHIRFYHFSASGAADIVPAQRDSDGELGLYNKTTGEFLEKIGSGTLVAGPEATGQPYTFLEYIESTGTQYIDTGINADSDLGVDFKYQFTSTSPRQRIGAIYDNGAPVTTNASNYIRHHLNVDSRSHSDVEIGYYIGLFDDNFDLSNPIDTNIHTFVLDTVNNRYIVDGNTNTYNADNFDTHLNYWLFIRNSNNSDLYSPSSMRIYYFKMKRNGALVRDFMPAKRKSDNAIGMYDTVTNTFFENSGTGTFTVGPETSSITTVLITWGGLAEPDASGMCVYGETFTAPSTAPTAPSGLKFLGWIPR